MTQDRMTNLRDFASRYSAAWCSGNAASVAAFYSPRGSLTINGGTPSMERVAITEAAQGFMTAFPDLMVYMGRSLGGQGEGDIQVDARRRQHWARRHRQPR